MISSSNQVYRPDIDGLRAVAVCSVIFFHAFPNILPGGFVGVDIFFVISGYLISSIIIRKIDADSFSFLEFYDHRIRRIFPALAIVLTVCLSFGWVSLLAPQLEELGKHVAAGAAFASNLALWGEAGYFDASAESKPLLHLWSLGIEEQFYILWPIALWVLRKRRRGAIALICVTGLLSLIVNIATRHSYPIANFYSPASRFWELQIGCLLAYATVREETIPKRYASTLSLTGTILIASSIWLFNSRLAFPGFWAILPTVGSAMLIAAGRDGIVNRLALSSATAVWLGRISYPLYLWHWPLLSFSFIAFSHEPPWWTRVFVVLTSLALSVATYTFIERPMRYGWTWKLKSPFLASILIVAGCIGYTVYASGGVPSRFPPQIQRIADFKYDFKEGARFPECWLLEKDPYNGFHPSCVNMTSSQDTVVIWGDSHAARLYPGLKQQLATVAISQFTRSSCPPIMNFGYEICQESNEYVMSKIARLKPRTVILFAVWAHYNSNWTARSDTMAGLYSTIQRLRKIGVENVVVLGPAPEWEDTLPKQVYRAWKNSYPIHRVPERMKTGLNREAQLVDKQLAKLLSGQPIRYVSVISLLCNKDGCLTHLPNRPDALLTWDYGHLTTDGAVLVSGDLIKMGALR